MANTGNVIYQNLEEYNVATGVATGNTKPNNPSDPDYVAPVEDLQACPVAEPEYTLDRTFPTTCDIESNQELSFFTLTGNSGDTVEIEGLFSGTCNDDRTDGATTRGEFTLTAEHSETVLDNIFIQEDATQNSSFLNFSITGVISFIMPANEITLSTRYIFENPGTNRQVNANVRVKTINGNTPTSNIVEQACTGFGDYA